MPASVRDVNSVAENSNGENSGFGAPIGTTAQAVFGANASGGANGCRSPSFAVI